VAPHAVEEEPRPDELGRQYREAHWDDDEGGAREDDQGGADSDNGETDDQYDEAARVA
jgi:hypothetical protein